MLIFSALSPALAEGYELGDVDRNGSVSAADAALILRYLVGLATLDDDQLILADANLDKKVTAADAAAILRALVKLDTLPPSKPTMTPAPTAEPTPTPVPTPFIPAGMKVEGDDYGLKVLEGVNEAREIFGSAPLISYGGSALLLERCIAMALGGVLLGPIVPNEATSKSHDGGKTMGIMCAVHSWEIGSGDYTTLYVASVLYNGTRWTIVRAE